MDSLPVEKQLVGGGGESLTRFCPPTSTHSPKGSGAEVPPECGGDGDR